MEASPRRIVYLLLGAACVFIIAWGIRWSANIINPILLAVVITMTVIPVPGMLQKLHVPGWLSLVLTIALVVGILLAVLVFSAYSINQLGAAIPSYADRATLQQQAPTGNQVQSGLTWLAERLVAVIKPQQFTAIALKVVELVGNSMVGLFMVLLIFAFMLSAAIAWPHMRRTQAGVGNPVLARLSGFTRDVRQYMVIMTLVNVLVGVGNTALLVVLGVDFAVLWGILSVVLGYIPSVGFWLALIPPVLLAYAESGVMTALIVFVAYVVINGGVQNLVQPRLMGQGLNISPLVVFVSVFVWGWLLGGIGAILSVPLTMIILEVLDAFPSTQWLAELARFAPGGKPPQAGEAPGRWEDGWKRVKGMF